MTKPKPPKAVYGITGSYFSIARHYGGMNFNGAQYIYAQKLDACIRADLFKKGKSRIAAAATEEELTQILNELEP